MNTNESGESGSAIDSSKEVEGVEQSNEKLVESKVDSANANAAPILPSQTLEGDLKPVDTIEGKDTVFTPSDAKVDSSDNLIEVVEKAAVLEAGIPDQTKAVNMEVDVLPSSVDQEADCVSQIQLAQEITDVNKVSSTSETEATHDEPKSADIVKSTSIQVPVCSKSMDAPKVGEMAKNSLEDNVSNSNVDLAPTISVEQPVEELSINPSTTAKPEPLIEIAPIVQNEPTLSVGEAKVEKSSLETAELPTSSTSKNASIQVIEKPLQADEKPPSEVAQPILEKLLSDTQPRSETTVKQLNIETKLVIEEPKIVPEKLTTETKPTENVTEKAGPSDEKLTTETRSISDADIHKPHLENVAVPDIAKPTVETESVVIVAKPTVKDVHIQPVVQSVPVIQSLLYSSIKTPAPITTPIEKSIVSKPETSLLTAIKAMTEKQVLPPLQIPEKSQESTIKMTPISGAKQITPTTLIQARVVTQQPVLTKVETTLPTVSSITTIPICQKVPEPTKIIATIVPNIETVTSTAVTTSNKLEVIAPAETKMAKVTTIHIKPIPEPVSEAKPTEITIEVPTTSLATGKDTVPPITLSKSLMVKTHTSEPITSTRIIIRPITSTSTGGETIKKLNIKPIIQPPTSPVKPEPIPRLIIKPVSSTRSVVESLPPKKSGEETISRIQLHVVPATSGKDNSGQRFEITTSPTKMVPKETSLAAIPKVEPLTLKRLATDQGHTVVPSKITCTPSSSQDTKTAKDAKSVEAFTICATNSPKSDPLASLKSDQLCQEATVADSVNLDLEVVDKDKDKNVPEAMDFEGDSFIDEASFNDVSLPASLCENEDFSFIKPKSADLVDGVVVEKNGTVPFIEEDTQSSWSLDPKTLPAVAKLKDCIDPTAKVIDEESRDSVGSVSSKKSAKETQSTSFPASSVFEYQWPHEKGEFYILQEQLCEFLGVKSFKRKHPDLPRRNVDKEERVFLKEKNVVSETQCDLGLTALRSEDVMELMSKDYPEKYQEYIRAQQEKQRQAIAIKNKEYAAANLDKNKIRDLLKKAMKSASEYNAHLNQERRDERKMSFDLQTYTIHVPANKKRKLDAESTKVGKYPVALLPGQYQDYYRKYTANELKYMPLNTVLYGPLQELSSINVPPGSDGSNSDSDGSDSEASCCSSSLGTQDGSGGDSSSGSETAAVGVKNDVYFKPKDIPSPCKICHGNQELNKQSQPEELIHCSQCKTSAHPTCLELPPELVAVIKTYEWQCMECKTCMLCMDPNDEEKMMFCDKCDRGFHTFCVGLKNLPSGRWICQLCGQCALCGSKTPGPEGTKLQWQQAAGEGNKKPQLLCVACSKKKAK